MKRHARQQIAEHALHGETDNAGHNRRRGEQQADIEPKLVPDQHEGDAQHDAELQQPPGQAGQRTRSTQLLKRLDEQPFDKPHNGIKTPEGQPSLMIW